MGICSRHFGLAIIQSSRKITEFHRNSNFCFLSREIFQKFSVIYPHMASISNEEGTWREGVDKYIRLLLYLFLVLLFFFRGLYNHSTSLLIPNLEPYSHNDGPISIIMTKCILGKDGHLHSQQKTLDPFPRPIMTHPLSNFVLAGLMQCASSIMRCLQNIDNFQLPLLAVPLFHE